MRPTRALRSLLLLAPLVFQSRPALAQRFWHDEQGRDAFRLDLGKPFIKGDGEKFPTGSIVGSLSVRAADGIRVEGDLPLMRAAYDFGAPAGSSSTFRLGNPYIGLRIGQDDHKWTGTVGFRLPFSAKPDTPIGQQAVRAGALSSFDEFEAFAPNFLTIRSALEYRRVSASKFLFGGKAGPAVLISTDGNPLRQSDVFFDYGGRVGYEGSGSLLTVGLTGRYLVTPADQAFEHCNDANQCAIERFHHAGTVTAELRYGGIRPRASVRIPFDKGLRDEAGVIVHLGVSIGN